MYFVYSALAAVVLVLTSPVWVLRMIRHGKYRAGVGERFGRVPERLRDPERRPTVWVHAVSVGEVLAATGLIAELQQRAPSYRMVVSTTTATGQKLARERHGAENVFYFPLDFAFAIRPYLRSLCPSLVVVAETEFWPNFFRLSHESGARVAVVNARISDRSFPRYRRFRKLLRLVLRQVDVFLAQSGEDRHRLIEIGAPSERVEVSGNLKFDIKPAGQPALVAQLKSALGEAGPILVCGSTVEGEEPIVVRAFGAVRERFPGAVMVLAPRHPERFGEVAALLASSGIPFQRRSQWNGAIGPGIFLLDSIGELAALYDLAEIAFVGGSLVPKGGHNILEAAQHGAAIVVGPHPENFRDIVELFRRADAVVVAGAEDLGPTLLNLLTDENRRREMGCRAREILRANAGATSRSAAALDALLSSRSRSEAEVAKSLPPVET